MQRFRTAILLIPLAIVCSTPTGAVEPTEEDWRWLAGARHVIDIPLPVLSANSSVVVAFRSYWSLPHYVPDEDIGDHERYCDIRQVGSPPWALVATVIAPVGRSLQEQLLTLHLEEPDATPEALQSRLLVTKSEVHEQHCPGLRSRFDRLPKVRVRVPAPNSIAIHPIVWEIRIRTDMGKIDATLYDQQDPLVRWARETFEVLNKCIAASR